MEESAENNKKIPKEEVETVKKEKKQETIMDTANTRETGIRNRKGKHKTRKYLVILFLIVYALINYVQLRGSYLEYMELGENYISIFRTNLVYRYSIMAINFVILYFIIYMTNRKRFNTFLRKRKESYAEIIK